MNKEKLTRGSVLISTSDQMLSTSLSAGLTQSGFNVLSTSDGNQAVSYYFEKNDVSLVLLDTDISGLNGYEVTRLLRKYGRADLPIIMLAWFSMNAMEMASQLGCNELIAKPVSNEGLAMIINKYSGSAFCSNN